MKVWGDRPPATSAAALVLPWLVPAPARHASGFFHSSYPPSPSETLCRRDIMTIRKSTCVAQIDRKHNPASTTQELSEVGGKERTGKNHSTRAASVRPDQRKKGTEMTAQPRAFSSFWRASISPVTASVFAVKWWGPSTSIAIFSSGRSDQHSQSTRHSRVCR